MNKDQLLTYMREPALLSKADVNELQRVVEEFPSSSILHALYVKALKSQGSYLYPKQLKRTAISVADRSILHQWVEVAEEVKIEEEQRIEFTAADAVTKAKIEAQKQREAEEKKKEAERKAKEKAAIEAREKAANPPEIAQPAQSKVAPQSPPKSPVVQTPIVQANPPKEVDLDLSNLPASVRETVMRARKIREQLGEEKPKSASIETPQRASAPVSNPIEITPPAQPVHPQAPPEPPVKVQEEMPGVPQPAENEQPVQTHEAIPQPLEETGFELSKEEPIKEEPFIQPISPASDKHSFIGWLQTGTQASFLGETAPEEVPNQAAPAPVEENFEISANEPIVPTPKAAQATEMLETFLEKPRLKFTAPGNDPKIETADLSTNAHSDYITETLAHVYVRQKLYNRAINAYEILRLKYPEKSSFFAAQILEVKNLQKEKE